MSSDNLEKSRQLGASLSHLICRPVTDPQLVYWSYCQAHRDVWPELNCARREFGEQRSSSSEPDLIVVGDNASLFVEAKFTSDNITDPSDPRKTKKYLTGGNNWYRQVFKTDYDELVNQRRRYELVRYWLLGSWIAAQLDCDFYLVSLVRQEQEKDIEQLFRRHLRANARRSFLRWSWEDIYRFVSRNAAATQDRELLMAYFENKSIGYSYSSGELQMAFQLGR